MKRVLLSIMVLLTFLLSVINCGEKTDLAIRFEMEKMIREADKLKQQLSMKGSVLSDKDFDTIIKAYTAITRKIARPKDSTEVQNASQERKDAWALASFAYIKIGLLYLDMKIYDKAFASFDEIATSPATTGSQLNAVLRYMAITKEKSKHYPEAASLYKTYASGYLDLVEPENPDLNALEAPLKAADMWHKAGENKKFKEEIEKANTYYSDLISKYPDTPLEHLAIGKIVAGYIRLEKYAEAIKVLQSERDDATGLLDPNLLLMVADIYSKNLKNFKGAEKTYREFISSNPEHDKLGLATLGLGLSLHEQGKYKQARGTVKDLETITRVKPYNVADAYYLSALCYEKEGAWEKALNRFDLIRATFPGSNKSFEALLYVASHYRDKGQKKLADKAYTEAEDYIMKFTNPETAGAPLASQSLDYLARCYVEQQDYSKAIETYTQLHNRYPKQPQGKLASSKIADLYENKLHDAPNALIWLKTYANENPDADDIAEVEAKIKALE